ITTLLGVIVQLQPSILPYATLFRSREELFKALLLRMIIRKEISFHSIMAPRTINVQGLGRSCGVLMLWILSFAMTNAETTRKITTMNVISGSIRPCP